MLGRRAGSSPRNLVMLNFARESCCCAFAATTALRGAHCGVGGRSFRPRRLHWRAAEAAEVACWLSVGLGDGSVGAGHLEIGGVGAGALVEGGLVGGSVSVPFYRDDMLTPTLACGSQQSEQGTAPPLRTAGGCVL